MSSLGTSLGCAYTQCPADYLCTDQHAAMRCCQSRPRHRSRSAEAAPSSGAPRAAPDTIYALLSTEYRWQLRQRGEREALHHHNATTLRPLPPALLASSPILLLLPSSTSHPHTTTSAHLLLFSSTPSRTPSPIATSLPHVVAQYSEEWKSLVCSCPASQDYSLRDRNHAHSKPPSQWPARPAPYDHIRPHLVSTHHRPLRALTSCQRAANLPHTP